MDQDYFEQEPEVDVHANTIEYGDARNHLAVQMLKRMRDNITHVIQLLETGDRLRATQQLVDLVSGSIDARDAFEEQTGSRVIEGVFDGYKMVGAEGLPTLSADLDLLTFWVGLPTNLPAANQPIANLNQKDLELIREMEKLKIGVGQTIEPAPPAGKSDPFTE